MDAKENDALRVSVASVASVAINCFRSRGYVT